jgi:hypothetical protein
MKQAMTNEPYMNVPTPQMRSRLRKYVRVRVTLRAVARELWRETVTQDSFRRSVSVVQGQLDRAKAAALANSPVIDTRPR